ncbi:MAG TPA: hypothetical protein PKJ62_07275 [Bacteroidia bacterium]|nr:hypothetical protein [Bacteroidia bacterium]HNS11437.1 hypothetical protein [Bacteroidia bacterium]
MLAKFVQFRPGHSANGSEEQMTSAGGTPLPGVRYQLSKRFSIIPEAGFSLIWEKNSRTDYYTSTGSQHPDKEIKIHPRIRKPTTLFEQPLSFFMTFGL